MKLLNKKDVGQRRVYDIEVEDVHNFYANGVNVHNCATDGGVSVIKDDGTVVDVTFTGYSNQSATVTFDEKSRVVAKWFKYSVCFEIPDSDFSTAQPRNIPNKEYAVGEDGYEPAYDVLPVLENNVTIDHAFAGPNGLSLLSKDNGMVNYITSSYQSGYQPGDIKLAALSDTDDTDLVGATPLDDDFTSYADQAAAEAAGWEADTGWSFDAANDKWDFDASVAGAGAVVAVFRDLAVVPGKTYVATAVISGITNVTGNELFIKADGNDPVNADGERVTEGGDGTYRVSFVASSATINVQVRSGGVTDGDETASLESFSVKLADADRSVNNNGLIVNGTVTREPVASGADLVSYSGFSPSNYLEQPYNPDLDFGTGDFCVMGWVKIGGLGDLQYILDTRDAGQTNGFYWFLDSTGHKFRTVEGGGVSLVNGVVDIDTGNYRFIAAVVSGAGTNLSLYTDGALDVAETVTALSVTSSKLRVGLGSGGDFDFPFDTGSLALLRISATAPTAEQIAKIYEDEKVLFQENAQATLYGTSDAVTALAHDPVTDLLHVSTSDGRSDFQGLRRVSNTTDSHTSLSASGGMIVGGS